MAHDKLHVGDTATIIITLKDNGVVVDISAATALEIKLQRPAGTSFSRTASFVTDGTDGKMKYKLLTTDLDLDGPWKIQAVVTETDDVFNSSVGKIQVNRNIPTV